MSLSSIVVVGAGQAGGWAARTLRSEGFAGRIVAVGAESHPPYERPPLSKAVLAGESAPQSTYLFQPEGLARFGVEAHYGRRAVSIERARSVVVLDDASELAYDRLILCTGGRARALALPGAELPGVHSLRTIDDAQAIGRGLAGAQRVVVIGAGWIGLEVAATARERGAQVTVVESAARPCARSVSPEISGYLTALHARHGVPLLVERRPAEIARAGGGLEVRLEDGARLPADLVVIGAGLVANDELASRAGIACDQGVLVDTGCRTSDPHIFAAGDVAVAPNRWAAARRIRLESWRNAQDQGVAAAKAALGQVVHYDPLPFFWSQQYDVNLQLYGVPAPSHRVVVRGSIAEGRFLAFYLEGGRVRAAAAPSAPREMRFARQLIEQQVEVAAEALADPAVPLASLAAGPAASPASNPVVPQR